MGVALVPARAAALEASQGATDFGQYFTYFSFFLMVSALMLAVLFFKLSIEQRLRQIGTLRAAGYPMSVIRRVLLAEALVLALIGGLVGVAGAILYGRIIVHGLGTWWIGAVGTTMLELHVRPMSLMVGAVGGVIAAAVCVFVSLRAVGRLSPRALLTAQSLDAPRASDGRRRRRGAWLAVIFAALGLGLLVLGFAMPSAQAGAFFGAGAALLVSSLLALSALLRARGTLPIAGRGAWAVARLGFRSTAFRPSRTVLSAALIASASFIIVSVDAFRREAGELTTDPKSGTGGYALFAESELPLLHNPNEASGREALGIQAPDFAQTRFTRFRVRAGDDASCLNLYRPTNPTIIAPEPGSSRAVALPLQRRWRRPTPSARIPGCSCAVSSTMAPCLWWQTRRRCSTCCTWVSATRSRSTPAASGHSSFDFVGALQDSVLQGELVIADETFVRLFPQQQGYQAVPDRRAIGGVDRRGTRRCRHD